MITNSIEKKALVEQLLRDGKVSIDEAFMLLEDNSIVINWPTSYPPIYPTSPWYNPWGTIYPLPVICGTGTITTPVLEVTSYSTTESAITNGSFYAGSTLTVTNPTTDSITTIQVLPDGTFLIPLYN